MNVLSGTEKQVKWASNIRENRIRSINQNIKFLDDNFIHEHDFSFFVEMFKEIKSELENETNARILIETRIDLIDYCERKNLMYREKIQCFRMKKTEFEKKMKQAEIDGFLFWVKFLGHTAIGEYKGQLENITLKCPKGHEWSVKPIGFLRGQECHFCEKENWFKKHGGRNNKNFKGSSTLSNYLRRKIDDWKWETIYKHDEKCVITGKPFEVVHHVYSFDLILKEVAENTGIKAVATRKIKHYTDDELEILIKECQKLHKYYGLGVCLTNEIHDEFHKIYGLGNNTKEQWEEFVKNKEEEEE